MLPAKFRLSKKTDFNETKTKGKLFKSLNFSLIAYNRKDKLNSKFGFIISKKISKRAVDRNRLKRILSEVVRNNLGEIKKGYNIVILAKQKMLKISKSEMEKEFLGLINKLQ